MKKIKNENKNKINIWHYLKNYKFGISMYILVYIVASAANILMTILLARAVEQITLGLY